MAWQFIIILSALFKGGQDIMFKRVLNNEHTTEALLNMTFMSFIIMLPFIFTMHFSYSPETYLILMLRAGILVAGNILFYKALRHADLSVVAPFYNLSPVFLIFISFLVLGEVLSLFELFGIGLLMLGTFVLKNEHTSGKDHGMFLKSKYVLYVVGALFLWSLSATFAKFVSSEMRTGDMLIVSYFFSTVLYLIYHCIRYDGVIGMVEGYKHNFKTLLFAALLGVISVYFYFYAQGMPNTKISLIVPLRRISVFIDILLGGTLLHEKNLLKKLSAAAVMLIGISIIFA